MNGWLKRYGHVIRASWVFLVAPLFGILSWLFVVIVLFLAIFGEFTTFDANGFLGFVLIASIWAYPITFAIGIPAYLIYRHFQIKTLSSYICGGFIAGLVGGACIFRTPYDLHTLAVMTVLYLTVAIAAAIEAAFFWMLVIKCTPDAQFGNAQVVESTPIA